MIIEENAPALVFKGVSFTYPALKKPTLIDIDLSVFRGERVGIIGGNGCGKSTLSKLILGILAPQKGKIQLLGKSVSWHQHFPEVGYIGDPGHNAEELGLPTHLRVGTVIRTIQKIEDSSGEAQPDKLDLLMKSLGLAPLLDRKIENLSTGERKRLMICLTFMRENDFIIMDEPLDGLDEAICEFIKGMIAQLAERSDLTLIYIAHDRMEIDSYTEKVFRLQEGRLVQETQKWFEGRLKQQEKLTVFREKTGQIMGRLNGLMTSEKVKDGFDLRINPIES